MCGIVGILGKEPVAPLLVDALKRLEYRGYDSAGVATLEADGGSFRPRDVPGKPLVVEGGRLEARNDAAVAFYSAHGFAKVGEAQHTADNVSGVPLDVYEKPLTG